MKRHEWNFDLWCRIATGEIRYGPDRKAVSRELRSHLEDAFEAGIARGLTEEEAGRHALDSMGRAEDLRPQLAAIHKPFWGYMIRGSQIAVGVLLALSLIPLWKYAAKLDLQDKPNHLSFDIYDAASYGGNTGRTLHHLSHPDISFSSDGNTFTVSDAALFTEYSEYYQTDVTRLYFLIRQTSILPWKEHEEYYQFVPVTASFFLRDDLGNEYAFYYEDGGSTTSGVQSGIFSYTHECWINNFPSDAQWVEICYERDGRSHTLRVDLTGGDRK